MSPFNLLKTFWIDHKQSNQSHLNCIMIFGISLPQNSSKMKKVIEFIFSRQKKYSTFQHKVCLQPNVDTISTNIRIHVRIWKTKFKQSREEKKTTPSAACIFFSLSMLGWDSDYKYGLLHIGSWMQLSAIIRIRGRMMKHVRSVHSHVFVRYLFPLCVRISNVHCIISPRIISSKLF